jgi:alanine racemase
MGMPVSTWVEVDLDRFSANLRAVRALVGLDAPGGGNGRGAQADPARGLLLVVKADAYGHGAIEMAEAAGAEGVACLGVAMLHEGIQLRQAGCRLPIVALSPLLPSEIREAVTHELDPTVSDLDFARALSAEAVRTGRAVRCHVETDTGMGRTGVREAEAEVFLCALVALPGLRLASLFTHFPDADSADLSFATDQVRRFRALVQRLEARGIRPPRLHAANSAGTVNLPDARFDWVRVGLLAYGHVPPNAGTRLDLKPVMSFKSRLVQVRDLPAGVPISYGRSYVTEHPMRVGVVAVGYGHGYSWLLSNRGHMLVGGQRVPIVGRVTMDLTMLDLTRTPDAKVGDDVVLFGEAAPGPTTVGGAAGGAELTLEEVAAGSQTLPYEIMCTIGKRVTRIYVRGGRPVKLTSLVGERAEWVAQATDHFRMRAEAVAAAQRGRG